MSWYKVSKKDVRVPLSKDELADVRYHFGNDLECSFAKDDEGYYCYTHRARSDSYDSIESIPEDVVEWVGSTG